MRLSAIPGGWLLSIVILPAAIVGVGSGWHVVGEVLSTAWGHRILRGRWNSIVSLVVVPRGSRRRGLSGVGLLRIWLGVGHHGLGHHGLRHRNESHGRGRSLRDDLGSRYDGLGSVVMRVLIVIVLTVMRFVVVASDNQRGLVPHYYQASMVLASPADRSHDGEEEHHREYNYHSDSPGRESCALLAVP